ncbi:MAG TPA: response regulator, partial [Nevskiaceae bacterium]|nr:response regulator [Nevskiaceae bacterium]
SNLKAGGRNPLRDIELYLAVRRDAPELAAALATAVASITPGELEALSARWFGVLPEPPPRPLPLARLALGAAAGLGLLLLLGLLRWLPSRLMRAPVAGLVGSVLSLQLLLLGLLAHTAWQLAQIQLERQRLAAAQIRTDQLADAIEHAARDRVRLAQTYALSQDPRYLAHYRRLLAIDQGRAPRPIDYDGSYWDRRLIGDVAAAEGPVVSIQQRINELGLPEGEFAELEHSLRQSALLVEQEAAWLQRLEAAGGDTAAVAAAREALFRPDYLQRVAEVHQGPRRFRELYVQRHARQGQLLREQEHRQRQLQAVAALGLALSFALALLVASRALGAPLQRLQAVMRRFAAGHFDERLTPAGSAELRELARTANRMADEIQADRERRERLQQEMERLRLTAETSAGQLLDIANTVPGVVFQLARDRDGRLSFPFLSGGLEFLTGIAREQAETDPLLLLQQVPEAERRNLLQTVNAAYWRRDGWRVVFRFQHPVSGRMRWLDAQAQPLPPDGARLLWNGYFRDVTDERETAERLQVAEAELSATLKRRASQFGSVIENAPSPIWAKDREGRYLFVNTAFMQVLQLEGETEVVGRRDEEVLPPGAASQLREHDARVLASGQTEQFIEAIPRRGYVQTLLSVKWPLRNEQEEIYAVGGMALDITEQVRLQEELQRINQSLRQREQELLHLSSEQVVDEGDLPASQRLVLRAIQSGLGIQRASVWTYDEAGQQLHCQLLLEGEQELPTPPALSEAAYPAYFEAIASRRAVVAEDALADPATRELASAYLRPQDIGAMLDVPIRLGGRMVGVLCCEQRARSRVWREEEVSYVGALADLLARAHTARQKRLADESLRELNTQLEARVAERTREAEAANAAKSSFLANMSHEIRTPMNAILGFAHLALRTSLDPRQRDYLSKIEAAASGLLGILNDILDVSKIEAGKLALEKVEFDLTEVLDRLIQLCGSRAESKGLEFHLKLPRDLPRALVGDPLRLGQVLINFANNAVKFTEQGRVLVEVERRAAAEGLVGLRFTVSDTGIGLSEAEQARLFQSFSQADAGISRRYGGTGLGLAISRQLAELMGGRVGVHSRPGEGSRFWLDLSLPPAPSLRPRIQALAVLENLPVLVVEPSAQTREIYRGYLESFGCTVSEADSLPSARLRLDGPGRPELVLCAYRLGRDSALDLQEALRSDATGPRPALFVVAGAGDTEAPQRCHDAGLPVCLARPLAPSALFDALVALRGLDSLRPASGGRLAAARRHLAGARVLLAEDNEINQQVARGVLEDVGVDLEVVADGRQALAAIDAAAARGDPYELVLMDLQMPEMDGLEATRRLRADPRWRQLPVLAMTANAMESDRQACLAAGMNDHLAKPIDLDRLYDSLMRWLPAREESRPLRAEARSETAALPSLPGVDAALGLARVGGQPARYRSLLQRFVQTQGDLPEQIAAALERGDPATAQGRLHSLRGTAASLGAERLAALAARIETTLRESRSAPASAPAEAVAALIEAMRELRVAVAALPVAETRRGLLSGDSGLLARLAEQIEASDSQALDTFEQFRASATEVPLALLAVEEALLAFDFDRAGLLLAEWRSGAEERPA